jgi:hypothetical protein
MMVVMEYLDWGIYTLLRDSKVPKNIVREGVMNAISTLHQAILCRGHPERQCDG